MAFAAPDPKRVEADRKRLEQRKLDDIAAIEQQKRIKQEIRACYFEGTTLLNGEKAEGYVPKQIKHAGTMIQNGKKFEEMQEELSTGTSCWEVLGRSNGGRTRGKLLRCVRV